MHTMPSILVLIGLLSLAGGCSRAVSPLANEQEKFFAHVKAADPAEERALRYAKYYSIAGRHDLAVAELEATLRKDPQNARLLNALGNIYDQLGDYRRAQEHYQKILAKDADNPLAMNNLGYSHYLAGDLSQAEKILQELLAKHPDNTIARNNLGLVWCRQGKQQDAVALWEKKDGPEMAQVKLQQVLGFLGRGKNATPPNSAPVQVAAGPRPSISEPPAALQEKTATSEPPAQAEAPAGATMPARNLTAPPLAQKSSHEPNALKPKQDTAAAPQVKVEEVAMIIQPASFNPSASAPSLPPVLSTPAAPKKPNTAVTLSPSRPGASDELELTALAEPREVKPWRRTPRFRMIPVPPVELPQTIKPLREYIIKPHSHQGLNPPAMPEMAVY